MRRRILSWIGSVSLLSMVLGFSSEAPGVDEFSLSVPNGIPTLEWRGEAGTTYLVESVVTGFVRPTVDFTYSGKDYALASGPAWSVKARIPGEDALMSWSDAGYPASGDRRRFYRVAGAASPSADAPEMEFIPGGGFVMGDRWGLDDAWDSNWDEPPHRVRVSAFWMSRTEVTNDQFVRWLNTADSEGTIEVTNDGEVRNTAGILLCRVSPNESRSRIRFETGAAPRFSVAAGYGRHPAVFVTSLGAAAFCSRYGMRLPTEAEWERAARGRLIDHHYPWPSYGPDYSDYISKTNANYYVIGEPHDTREVGSYTPNDYGLYDMAGNVSEWCSDWFQSTYYASYPPDGWPADPTGPLYTGERVIRGGDFNLWDSQLRCCVRQKADQLSLGASIGFRCAMDP